MSAMPTKESRVSDLAHRHAVGGGPSDDAVLRVVLSEVLRVHHPDVAPAAVVEALESSVAEQDGGPPGVVDTETSAPK
jgi:hypothetical protein